MGDSNLRKRGLTDFGFDNDKEGNMGRIVVTEFVSLDGVMQAPGGGEEFKHAGWTFKVGDGVAILIYQP